MNELGREARAFLATARGAHDAPPDAKDRVRVGLAVALTAPAATGAGAAALAAGGRARWLMVAKLATVLGIVGAGAGAILGHSVHSSRGALGTSEARRTGAGPAASAPVVGADRAALRADTASGLRADSASGVDRAALRADSPSVPSEAAEPPPTSPTVVVAAPPPPRVATTAPAGSARRADAPSEGSVAAEVAILRRVSAALRAGDPRSALAPVGEHARRFPHGALAEERDMERIVALCALGQRDEAARATDRFERSYPSSSHEARVRAACAAPSALPPALPPPASTRVAP